MPDPSNEPSIVPIVFDMEMDEDEAEIDMEIETDEESLDMSMESVIPVPVGEYYDGDYTVEPDAEPQTLRTQGLLMRDNVTVAPIRPATTAALGSVIVGADLEITEEGVLSVQKADAVEQDNTHPITAAAVYTEVGNINALLQTI